LQTGDVSGAGRLTMCGIAGWLRIEAGGPGGGAEIVAAMTETLRHRGPDGGGIWQSSRGGVALGHRRLNVIDLSDAGGQPMQSASGRWVLTYNGEIYNHRALRAELEAAGGAPRWRGTSDTETLLAAIEHWGVEGALQRAVGMFALAVWDERERRLTLARDRMGEKPLYVGRADGALYFASELKAFARIPAFAPSIDEQALALYLWFGSIPAPHSIYRDIRKLAPGSLLTIDSAGRSSEARYWRLEDSLAEPRFAGTAVEAAGEVERLLKDAVRLQLAADVPVGAFLSGGVDSSLVTALMCDRAPVRTFAIGFDDAACDESGHARAVAAHLGTEHVEMVATAADAAALIPRLAGVWDEPFADSSQIPVLLVSQLARRDVTVSLTGDGGDELFCGYPSHRSGALLEGLPAKPLLAGLLRAVPPAWSARLYDSLPLPKRDDTRHWIEGLAHRLSLPGPAERFAAAAAHWSGEPGLLRASAVTPLDRPAPALPPGLDRPTLFSAIDALTYLPDDLLVKTDRAAMAHSLETRMPFLDHRLVEFAFRLPSAIKLHGGRAKWPIRAMLEARVPRALVDRPKQGFAIPLARWLRGPLRDWADDMLARDKLARLPMLDGEAVARLWTEHRDGRADHSARLWNVAMLQSWLSAR
jgi:asparagine synthase (glutamine-hydrolysing)